MGQVYQWLWRIRREIYVLFYFRISHVLGFISISVLFTNFPIFYFPDSRPLVFFRSISKPVITFEACLAFTHVVGRRTVISRNTGPNISRLTSLFGLFPTHQGHSEPPQSRNERERQKRLNGGWKQFGITPGNECALVRWRCREFVLMEAEEIK
jgi:hypothetical protein